MIPIDAARLWAPSIEIPELAARAGLPTQLVADIVAEAPCSGTVLVPPELDRALPRRARQPTARKPAREKPPVQLKPGTRRHRILALVAEHGPVTTVQIAEWFGAHSRSLGADPAFLHKNGYLTAEHVRRVRDGRKLRLWHITERGRAALRGLGDADA